MNLFPCTLGQLRLNLSASNSIANRLFLHFSVLYLIISTEMFDSPLLRRICLSDFGGKSLTAHADAELTPRNRVCFEKLILTQQVKKFPAFCITRKFIFAFARANHWILYWPIKYSLVYRTVFVYFNLFLLSASISFVVFSFQCSYITFCIHSSFLLFMVFVPCISPCFAPRSVC
jgi:hypothetical protein